MLDDGPFSATPCLDALSVTIADGALVSRCTGHCDMSLGTRLDFTVTTTMPFVLDADGKIARCEPDPHPKVTHTVGLPGVLDT